MIPQIWKVRIKLSKNITLITCENFEYVKKNNKKSCQYFYRKIVLNHFEPPTKQQERWKEELNTEIVNWDLIYKISLTKYCMEF